MSIRNSIRSAHNMLEYKKNNVVNSRNSVMPIYKNSSIFYTKSSIINTIFNRIAIDVSMLKFEHIREQISETTKKARDVPVDSELSRCIQTSSNIDQTGQQLIQDCVQTMFEHGHAVIVPIETSDYISENINSYEIYSLRIGRVIRWYPKHVKVLVYNEEEGKDVEVILEKTMVGIVENPFYQTINSENATLKRLLKKLSIFDNLDEKLNSQKIDMIIQLPYAIKSDRRKTEANDRIKNITEQLEKSEYGIAYIDASERITQLNRPVTNNLLTEVQYLTEELFNQLGLTKNILNGTASETELNSYYTRSIYPIAKLLCDVMTTSFFTRTAYTQGHRIKYTRSLFETISYKDFISSITPLMNNEIMYPNEFRRILGLQYDDDEKSDQLKNRSLVDMSQFTDEENEEEEEDAEQL